MKKMKMLKIAISTITSTVIMMNAMSSLAASYSAKTTYKAGDKIGVEAKATGLAEGDIVTYVASTNDEVTESSIVYLNQKSAGSDGSVTFNYTTDVTNIDAKMFFGGSKETTRQTATTDGYTLTVLMTDLESFDVVVSAQDPGLSLLRKINLGSDKLNGKIVTGVTYTPESGTGTSIEAFSADASTLYLQTDAITGDGTLTITTESEPSAAQPVIGTTATIDTAGNLTTVAKAVGSTAFGILIYKNQIVVAPTTADSYSNASETEDLVILPALAKNAEGIYAVIYEGFGANNGYKAAAYSINNGEVSVSEAVDLTTEVQ